MGWFDSTIDGIGSAVNWVTSNSGTISGVFNAVSTVASLLVATSPVDNAKGADTDTPPDLFVTFNQANQYLENEASYMLGKILPKLPNVRIVKMSGLWTGASPIDATGDPSLEMNKDIAKTGYIRGQRSSPAFSLVLSHIIWGADGPQNYIYTPNVTLANDENTCAISVIHAYYAVPLGKTGNDNTWHGAVQLAMGTNSDFDRQAYPYVQAAIKAVAPDYAIIYYTNDGQLQTIKIQAPENITPAQVRAAIN
ncbi:hypothetical protein V496_02967 [Pseudogymnoascus sp. VKM F-4515 (FW-2607)]|nr:hypothetical protein V496_02967 [Pseudogymnoascus sp. VKM F-4515 (FW-2607)]KFY78442.1 hypothetical protein V498_09111 [Pseudogymnoascus sp. VKM F-4517 (FW-2822)]